MALARRMVPVVFESGAMVFDKGEASDSGVCIVVEGQLSALLPQSTFSNKGKTKGTKTKTQGENAAGGAVPGGDTVLPGLCVSRPIRLPYTIRAAGGRAVTGATLHANLVPRL